MTGASERDTSVSVLLTLMFTTLPPVTLLVLGYIVFGDMMSGLMRLCGRRFHPRLRAVWRFLWLCVNTVVFGTVVTYMMRECILPFGDGMCTHERPLGHPTCLVLACATCVTLLVFLFVDRLVGPLVFNEPVETVYRRGRVQRVAWGGSLCVAWAAVSDLDSTAILVLFGLAARRALEPWVAEGLLYPLRLGYKTLTIWTMGRTLTHGCEMLVPRLAVGSVLAIAMW